MASKTTVADIMKAYAAQSLAPGPYYTCPILTHTVVGHIHTLLNTGDVALLWLPDEYIIANNQASVDVEDSATMVTLTAVDPNLVVDAWHIQLPNKWRAVLTRMVGEPEELWCPASQSDFWCARYDLQPWRELA